jgi:uncharacterized membrane protein HdeD (DUF308 family)
MQPQEPAMQAATPQQSAGVPWWLILIEGIFAIVIGLLLFSAPKMTTVVLVQFVGIYFLVAGMFKIISIFMDRSMWGWKLLAGVLGIIAGLLVLQHPLWSPFVVGSVLTIILGVEGLIIGTLGLVQAFRGGGWGMGALGVLSLVLGIILLANVWIVAIALPWIVGFFAVVGGIVAVVQAFRMK